MTDLSSKSVLVVDHGIYADLASALVGKFGKVQLFCPWTHHGDPKSEHLWVGRGLAGVERVDELWPAALKADLVIFPDIYFGALQVELRARGRRVWGSALGEELELFRDFSKKALKKAGVSIGKYAVVHGMSGLVAALKERDTPCFVKLSRTRGDMETFLAESFRLIEPRLDKLAHDLGALKESIDFIIEEPIDDAVELGYDGFSVDGAFPSTAIVGIEVKDKGYIGKVVARDALPKQLVEVNDAIAPLLKRYKYRNLFSTEVRIQRDGSGWLVDPCCRFPRPGSEASTLLWTNLADILWSGADGDLVEPESSGAWVAELLLISQWACHNWQAIDFPSKMRENVRISFPVVIDDRFYCVPQHFDMPAVGTVSAVGATMKDAIKACRKVVEQIAGYYIDIPTSSLDAASDELKKLEEFGVTL